VRAHQNLWTPGGYELWKLPRYQSSEDRAIAERPRSWRSEIATEPFHKSVRQDEDVHCERDNRPISNDSWRRRPAAGSARVLGRDPLMPRAGRARLTTLMLWMVRPLLITNRSGMASIPRIRGGRRQSLCSTVDTHGFGWSAPIEELLHPEVLVTTWQKLGRSGTGGAEKANYCFRIDVGSGCHLQQL
jgi:hypothetical protein